MTYKIYIDGNVLHNPALDDPAHMVSGAVLTKEVNMADSLTFSVYPQNAQYSAVDQMLHTVEAYRDDVLLFRGRVLTMSLGWYNEKIVTCESDFAAFNDTVVRPYTFTGSVADYLRLLVTRHNAQVPAAKQFTVRTVTVEDPNDTIVRESSGYPTTMSELQEKLVGDLGGYLIVERSGNTNYLDYLEDSTTASAQEVHIERNLVDCNQDLNGADIVTGLIPLGAKDDSGNRLTIASVNSGSDYIVNQAAVDRYGLILATNTWDDVTVPANLKAKGQKLLAELVKPVKHISLTAVDLSQIDATIEAFKFFSYVTVTDTMHGTSGRYLVSRLSLNFDDPSGDRLELGKDVAKASKGSAKNAELGKIIKAEAVTNPQMTAAVNNATDRISGVNGGNVIIHYDQNNHPYEVIYMDTDSELTAVNCVRMNHQGIGMSTTGVNGPYTQALVNGVGLNASAVVTGTLSADRIAAGSITADKIAANAVTAQKIAIGNFENFVDENPEDATTWDSEKAASVTAPDGTKSFKKKTETATSFWLNKDARSFNLSAGDQIYFKMLVYVPTASSDGNSDFRIVGYNESGEYVAQNHYTLSLSSGWNEVEGTLAINSALSGSVKYRLLIYQQPGHTTQVHVASPYAQVKRSGEIIVDGTLTASKIKADEVLTQHLTARDLDITGGSVNIQTDSESASLIKLVYGVNYYSQMSSGRFVVRNSDNGHQTNYEGGGLFIKDYATSKTRLYMTPEGGFSLYNANGSLLSQYGTEKVSYRNASGDTIAEFPFPYTSIAAGNNCSIFASGARNAAMIVVCGGNNVARMQAWIAYTPGSSTSNMAFLKLGGEGTTVLSASSQTYATWHNTTGVACHVWLLPFEGHWILHETEM